MKELTSYNRVAGYLNKLFDLLNAEFFESALSRPTITIQSTPRAYGHFSLREDTWVSKLGGTHEINIGAGTLARPIEEVAATLLHEMVHYFNYENGIQDSSRGNTYHNKKFKAAAEAHGLNVEHSKKYGWSHTSPSDALLDFILENGLTDILINRNEYSGFQTLERERIPAAVHQILFCERVTEQMNTCLFHAAPSVVLGNRTPQAVFRQLYAVLIGKQVFIPTAAAYPHILPQNAAEGFTEGDNLRPLIFGMPQINHLVFNVHVLDLNIADGGGAATVIE